MLRELDREFIQKNISSGGSPDMLALTYFIDSPERDKNFKIHMDEMTKI